MASDAAVVVSDLSKRFRVYHQRHVTLKQALLRRGLGKYEEFWALQDVAFEVPHGATLGIIGENGSGKSTLLKCIAGILVPEKGKVHVEGRLAALLELGAGFHQEYSGRENIFLNGALLGLPRSYIQSVYDQIVEFSELGRFIDNPVKTYSSGMYARLGFSIAVHVDPDVVVLDEVLAVGDESFQRKCYERISQMKREGRTMLVVSHDLDAVTRLASHCLWMENGRLRASGPVKTVVSQYLTEVNIRQAAALRQATVEQAPGGTGVTGMTFIGPDGPGTVFETGDAVQLQVHYASPRPLKGARFTLNIIREDDVLAFSTATEDSDTYDVTLPAQGSVTLSIRNLNLLDGLYRAGVGITDIATETPYVEFQKAFPFQVRNPPRKERGVALQDCAWELPTRSEKRATA